MEAPSIRYSRKRDDSSSLRRITQTKAPPVFCIVLQRSRRKVAEREPRKCISAKMIARHRIPYPLCNLTKEVGASDQLEAA